MSDKKKKEVKKDTAFEAYLHNKKKNNKKPSKAKLKRETSKAKLKREIGG